MARTARRVRRMTDFLCGARYFQHLARATRALLDGAILCLRFTARETHDRTTFQAVAARADERGAEARRAGDRARTARRRARSVSGAVAHPGARRPRAHARRLCALRELAAAAPDRARHPGGRPLLVGAIRMAHAQPARREGGPRPERARRDRARAASAQAFDRR